MRGARLLASALVACAAVVAAPVATATVVDDRLSTVVQAPGDVGLFARGDGGTVVGRGYLNGWTNWIDLGGIALTSGPASALRPDGTVDLLARGSDNAIHHRYRSNGVWTDWGSIGGSMASAPAAAARKGTGNLDVFARGTDGAIHFKTWTASTGWVGWSSLGGSFKYAPAAISHETGKIDVFAVGTDNQLYQKHWNGSAWSGWLPLGGALSSAPAVVSQTPGQVDVFARDANNNIAQRSWNGAVWSSWVWISTVATSAPAAYSEGVGRVTLLVRGGSQVYYNVLNTGSWSGWQPWGPTAAGSGIDEDPQTGPDSGSETADAYATVDELALDPDAGDPTAAATTRCKSTKNRYSFDVAGVEAGWATLNARFCRKAVAKTTWSSPDWMSLDSYVKVGAQIAGYSIERDSDKIVYNVSYGGSARGRVHMRMHWRVKHCVPLISICTTSPTFANRTYGRYDGNVTRSNYWDG